MQFENSQTKKNTCTKKDNTFSSKKLRFSYHIELKYLQEEGWVICRAFKKRTTGQTKRNEGWESSYYFYDEPSGVSSVVDPMEYMSRQPQSFLSQSLMCKHEIEEAENLSFVQQADQYLQLPQLESPSLPILKKPIGSIFLTSENSSEEEEEEEENRVSNNTTKKVTTTDWRALDKFVASQLSQEDRSEGESSLIRRRSKS